MRLGALWEFCWSGALRCLGTGSSGTLGDWRKCSEFGNGGGVRVSDRSRGAQIQTVEREDQLPPGVRGHFFFFLR